MAAALDNGFDNLRQLRKVMLLQQTHSTLTTSGMSVQITTQHVPDSRWVFVYRVRITSRRSQGNVQIRTRHIQVQTGGHRVEERLLGTAAPEFALAGMTGGMTETQPYAAGVVGQQPVLAPDQTFEYFSGTRSVDHCAGTILGGYGVTDMTTGEVFDVDLPAVGFQDFDCVEELRQRYQGRLDDNGAGSDEEHSDDGHRV
jgi:uncharacterized protein affecting Mg2+/Co2+ transport